MGGRQLAPEAWLPFFERLENTGLGTVVRESIWAFPIIEAIHLLGLGLLGGALLLVDLRLWGTGLRRQPIASVVRHAQPWLLAGVAVTIGWLVGNPSRPRRLAHAPNRRRFARTLVHGGCGRTLDRFLRLTTPWVAAVRVVDANLSGRRGTPGL